MMLNCIVHLRLPENDLYKSTEHSPNVAEQHLVHCWYFYKEENMEVQDGNYS